MNKKRFLVLLFAVILGISNVLPVFATSSPTNITIESVQVVRNVIEPNDFSLVFHYYIAYTSYPNETATDTFIFRLYSPDGLTLLATTSPYAYFNNGYGNGAAGFYFDNTTAPAWGAAYIINISGSPAFFNPLPSFPGQQHIVASDEYSTVTTQEANQLVMRSYIFGICDAIEHQIPAVLLHGNTDSGTALTSTGEDYFRGAVNGIQSISPQLFLLQFFAIHGTDIPTDLSLPTATQASFNGSDLYRGFSGLGAYVGLDGNATAGGFTFIMALIVLIIAAILPGWGTGVGLFLDSIVLTAGGQIIGGGIEVLLLGFAFVCGIVMMLILFSKRA